MHNLFTCPQLQLYMFMFTFMFMLFKCLNITFYAYSFVFTFCIFCIIRLNNSFDIYREIYAYLSLTTASAIQYVHLVVSESKSVCILGLIEPLSNKQAALFHRSI